MVREKFTAPPDRSPTSINIDREIWKEFKVTCAQAGRTVTEQLERMIRHWIAAKQRTNKRP